MTNELAPSEFEAIKTFANGLKECFLHYKKTHNEEFSNIVLEYVVNIINIHLDLTELKVGCYLNNMAKEFEKKGLTNY